MYTLYDPDLTCEYTEAGEVRVYDQGKLIAHQVITGLQEEAELFSVAKSLVESAQEPPIYTSMVQAYTELGMTKQNLHVIISSHLIKGLHYITAGAYRLLTPRGWALLKSKYKKD